MKQDYPVPPPELLGQWLEEAPPSVYEIVAHVAKQAAAWGYRTGLCDEMAAENQRLGLYGSPKQ